MFDFPPLPTLPDEPPARPRRKARRRSSRALKAARKPWVDDSLIRIAERLAGRPETAEDAL
jgi:hypothetical protein